MYYNGVAPSQYVIAEHIGTSEAGTDMTRIAPYLVEKTGKSYNLYPIGEFLSYRTNIINNIKIDKPMIIDIKTKSGVQWPYQTDGHFLVVSGISLRNQIGRIYMTDPHPSGVGRWDAPDGDVYAVNLNHFRKSIIR